MSLTVFGFCAAGASSTLRASFAQFTAMLAKRAGGEVALFEATSYEDLATAVISRYVDVAWLPPIPFVSLDRIGAVTPLVHLRRGGRSTFRSAIVVRDDSPVRELAQVAGKRAAWVDRYSASGFVVPRVELAAAGVDLSFPQQRFFHSHDAVVRAVALGLADFGATYAGVSPDGGVARGPWLAPGRAGPSLRAVGLLGDIPGDVLVARAGLRDATRERVRDALLHISRDGRSKLLAHGAFGVDEFCAFDSTDSTGYAELARVVGEAAERGWLDVAGRADESGAHALL